MTCMFSNRFRLTTVLSTPVIGVCITRICNNKRINKRIYRRINRRINEIINKRLNRVDVLQEL